MATQESSDVYRSLPDWLNHPRSRAGPSRILKLPLPPLSLQELGIHPSKPINDFTEEEGFDYFPTFVAFPRAVLFPFATEEPSPPPTRTPLRSRRWRPDEDAELDALVEEFGVPNDPEGWTQIAKKMSGGGRTRKQCKNRWKNHLAPDINREPWSQDEDALLLKLQAEVGNAWSAILDHFPGRSYASLKNRWYGTVRFQSGKTRPA